MPDIIAIGGGQASFSFINKLRLLGYKKSVTLICGENFLPYQRPPLSKKFLIGDFEKERLFLKPQSFYDENNIEVIKGQKVKAIDRKKSKVLPLCIFSCKKDSAIANVCSSILLSVSPS